MGGENQILDNQNPETQISSNQPPAENPNDKYLRNAALSAALQDPLTSFTVRLETMIKNNDTRGMRGTIGNYFLTIKTQNPGTFNEYKNAGENLSEILGGIEKINKDFIKDSLKDKVGDDTIELLMQYYENTGQIEEIEARTGIAYLRSIPPEKIKEATREFKIYTLKKELEEPGFFGLNVARYLS